MLFLKDNISGRRRKLLSYKVRVAILWNSRSDFFSVTEYTDTDHSECTMMSVDPKIRPVGVIDVLSRQLTPDTWAKLKDHLGDHKFLVEGWLWEGATALQANISTDISEFPTGMYVVLVPRTGVKEQVPKSDSPGDLVSLRLSAQWAGELDLKMTNNSRLHLMVGVSADGSLPFINGEQCEIVIHSSAGTVPTETRYMRIRQGEEQPSSTDSEQRSGDVIGALGPNQSVTANIVPGIYYDLNPSEKYEIQLVCGNTKSNTIVANLRH